MNQRICSLLPRAEAPSWANVPGSGPEIPDFPGCAGFSFHETFHDVLAWHWTSATYGDELRECGPVGVGLTVSIKHRRAATAAGRTLLKHRSGGVG